MKSSYIYLDAKDVICTRAYNHDFFGGDCGGNTQGGRGHCTVNFTGTQSLITMLSYLLRFYYTFIEF